MSPKPKSGFGSIIFPYAKKYRGVALFFLLVAILFLITPGIKNILLLAILFVVGAFSQIHQKFIQPSLGFECYLFGTVIAGFIFGPATGATFGLLVTLSASAISGRISASSLSVYLTISLMGFLAPYAVGLLGITAAGILLSVISSAIITSFFMFYFGSDVVRAIVYTSTNLILNILLFSVLGPPLVAVMV